MPKPVSEWTEDDVLSLPPGENDTFERKGSELLDLTLARVREDAVRDELAKQLSAFANMGGGQIIYGLTNAGTVDNGGIARSVKGRQSTKEWLEDVIPTLTDFEIVGFNVYEIPPNATGSSLAADKSIYVVDVPDSERAPHQSKRDLKYYVRLGSKSLPAPHRLIEDIRNRARHPQLEVHDLHIISAAPGTRGQAVQGVVSEFLLNMNLGFGVRNTGKVRAANACLQLAATIPLSMNMGFDEYFLRRGAPGTALLELKSPLYPGMGVTLSALINVGATVEVLAQGESLTLAGLNPDDVMLSINIFADSAPARKPEFRLTDIDTDHVLARVVAQEVKDMRFSAQRRGGGSPHTPWS
jgi:hypothetical protein